jgi:hypothetical protein
MQADSESEKKTYSLPTLTHLTAEQARQFLADHANCGNQGAMDFLTLLHLERKRDDE